MSELRPPFLVCAECRDRLSALGALASTERVSILLGRGCDVHPDHAGVGQAQHAVFVSLDVLRAFREAAARDRPVVPPELLEPGAVVVVAELAASLLQGAASDDAFISDMCIKHAVSAARRLLLAAKEV